MGVQSLGDKEIKWVVQNQLKSFKNGSLIHLVYYYYTMTQISYHF